MSMKLLTEGSSCATKTRPKTIEPHSTEGEGGETKIVVTWPGQSARNVCNAKGNMLT